MALFWISQVMYSKATIYCVFASVMSLFPGKWYTLAFCNAAHNIIFSWTVHWIRKDEVCLNWKLVTFPIKKGFSLFQRLSLIPPKLEKLAQNCYFSEKDTSLDVTIREKNYRLSIRKVCMGSWRTSLPWPFLPVNENNANPDIIKKSNTTTSYLRLFVF